MDKKDNFTQLHKEYTCRHPEHNPPTHRVFDCAGIWTCPECGHEIYIQGPDIFRILTQQ